MKKIIKKLLLPISVVKHKKRGTILKSFVKFSTKIGEYVMIGNNTNLGQVEEVGIGTYIGCNCEIIYCNKIGKFCSIANDVKIALGEHPKDWVSTSPVFYSKGRKLVSETVFDYGQNNSSTIENDVWIGTQAIILNGITIKNGAIVAAGSVVTKDVPEYAIVAGVPAKIIGYRFSKDIIENLIKLKWWERDILLLKEMTKYINDVDKFIKEMNGKDAE